MVSKNNDGLGLARVHEDSITIEKMHELFPSKRNSITEEVVASINETLDDPIFDGHSLMNSLVYSQSVMTKHSASIREYVDAVKFCAFLIGFEDNAIDAYKKTFWKRDFVRERTNADSDSIGYKELSSAASRYRRSPIVTDILAHTQTPLYLMAQHTRYKALGVLENEMIEARHSKDRIAAARAILEVVKPPENVKIELDIGVTQKDTIEDLRRVTRELAETQLKMIESGNASARCIAHSTIVEAEVVTDE